MTEGVRLLPTLNERDCRELASAARMKAGQLEQEHRRLSKPDSTRGANKAMRSQRLRALADAFTEAADRERLHGAVTRARGERGQVFVELALALPLLVGLMLAVATLGYAMGTRGQLANAARVAAVAYANGDDPRQAALDASDLDAATLTVATTLSEGAGGLLYGVCLSYPVHVSMLVQTWDRTARSCAVEERSQ